MKAASGQSRSPHQSVNVWKRRPPSFARPNLTVSSQSEAVTQSTLHLA